MYIIAIVSGRKETSCPDEAPVYSLFSLFLFLSLSLSLTISLSRSLSLFVAVSPLYLALAPSLSSLIYSLTLGPINPL